MYLKRKMILLYYVTGLELTMLIAAPPMAVGLDFLYSNPKLTL